MERSFLPLIALFLAASLSSPFALATPNARQLINADSHWRFQVGDPAGAESPSFDDSHWRTVDLPHDWSIESAPEEKNPTGSSGGYFQSGIGWYRKSFTTLSTWKGKRVSIEFHGIASNATVYLNGKKLSFHPYAYTSFQFEVTSCLVSKGLNVLAVRVDDSEQPSSRWYSGAGIYRHVRIVVTDPVHFSPWGVFITTPNASHDAAAAVIRVQIQNETSAPFHGTIRTTILSPRGERVGSANSTLQLGGGTRDDISQEITLAHPALWSPQSPTLYSAVTEILHDDRVVDRVETDFGIRTLSWSVERGLMLNGQSIKLAGGSVHHDNGPLGAAAFDRAEVRKVELLKAAGFNAVRTAHNPPSTAFLDACDRLGVMVLEEPFDVWTVAKRRYDYARYFKDWWKEDLDAMVKRDRNHPSIIMWGIGNEIPEVWTKEGAPIAKQLADRVRSLDSTRPITQAFPGATYGQNPDSVMSLVDVSGYNYNLAQNQQQDHARVPGRIMMTTESFPADAFEQWKLVHDHPYIVGEFVWTAMDYLGESGIGAWSFVDQKQFAQLSPMKNFMRTYLANMGADGKNPMAPYLDGQPPSPISPGFPWHAANCGDIDLTGYRKPQSFYRDILWNGGNRVYATVRIPEPEGKEIIAIGWAVYPTMPSWTWPGQEGKDMQVEVYSGTPSVRLYLNDKLIGELPTKIEQERRALFTVPYSPGVLKAVGINDGREVATSILKTAGVPVALRLTADRTEVHADNEDLSFITVEAVDESGELQPNTVREVSFSVRGPGSIIAVGNGDGSNRESYRGNRIILSHGRALVVLRTSNTPGTIQLTAEADGLKSAEVRVLSKTAESRIERNRSIHPPGI